MAKAKQSKFEQNREYALYFTMALSLIYALYWAVISIANIKQTGAVKVLGTVLLVALVAGGMVMGFLYAVKSSRK